MNNEKQPRRQARESRKKLYEFNAANDIRYRGPLSYRAFRILGWLCIAMSQEVIMLSLKARLIPEMADPLTMRMLVLSLISNLALPLLLIANFSLILNAAEGYEKQLIRFGAISLGIITLSVFIYHRYAIGSVAVFTESRSEAADALHEAFYRATETGFLSFNLFIDLFLCTLLMFFLNYRPKRLFTGKRLGVFRAFAVLPIAYEAASIVLKYLSVEGKVTLPFGVFPLLTVKPPMCFLVFVILVFFIKNRERHFRENGRTHEEYRQFLETKRNSLQFSRFTAIIMAVCGVLDVIAAVVVAAVIQHRSQGVELPYEFISARLDALGVGQSISLLLLAPLMLLFSYTRMPKNKNMDIFVPLVGFALIVLVYIEGGYRILQVLPDALDAMDLGELGEIAGFAGLLMGP